MSHDKRLTLRILIHAWAIWLAAWVFAGALCGVCVGEAAGAPHTGLYLGVPLGLAAGGFADLLSRDGGAISFVQRIAVMLQQRSW